MVVLRNPSRDISIFQRKGARVGRRAAGVARNCCYYKEIAAEPAHDTRIFSDSIFQQLFYNCPTKYAISSFSRNAIPLKAVGTVGVITC